MTKAPEHAALRELVTSVIDGMNRLAPDDQELERQWNEAQANVSDLEPDLRMMLSPDTDQMKMYRDFQIGENRDYANLFQVLATRGRLPASDLCELADAVNESVISAKFTAYVDRMEAVPEFKDNDGRAAYAVLAMAQASGDVGFYVVFCRQCKKLALLDTPAGKGRRSTDFCSTAHRNAYGQAQHRQKKKRAAKAAARKHK
jgi:hypothetical protein